MIERYLAELKAALPGGPFVKRRILAEVEDHLREAVWRGGSEEEALARLGPPPLVASQFAAIYAARATHRAVQVLALALGVAFLGVYPIPENVLPPAPWPGNRPPDYLHWKQNAVLALFALAALAGAAAFAVARGYRVRGAVPRSTPLALTLAAVSVASLTGTLVLGTVLALQWHEAVPAAPGEGWIALCALLELVLVGAAVTLAARAAAVRSALR